MPRGCASREPRRRRQESASRREERDGATMPSTRLHHGCPSSCCSLRPCTGAAVVGLAAAVQGELNQCLSIGSCRVSCLLGCSFRGRWQRQHGQNHRRRTKTKGEIISEPSPHGLPESKKRRKKKTRARRRGRGPQPPVRRRLERAPTDSSDRIETRAAAGPARHAPASDARDP